MAENYSPDQYKRLEDRVHNLAQDKSHLQLIVKMMNRLGELPGLENTINTLIQLLLESIGGSNATVYYWIDQTIFISDINQQNHKIEKIEDEYVKTVIDTKEFLELESDFEKTKLVTNEFTRAYSWIWPLISGNQFIGVIKIDDLHITSKEFKKELQTFFNYAALVIKNEVLGHTQLKKAFDQINESEVRFHSLFDNMREGVALHTVEFQDGNPIDYRIIEVNTRFEQILDIRRDQIVGKLSTIAYNCTAPPYFKEYVDVTLSKKPIFFESHSPILGKYFAISVVPWMENGFATIFTDISIRKHAEEEIKLKNKELIKLNAEKDRFFSIIAHDLKSPFNSIIGFSELLIEQVGIKDYQNISNFANVIQQSSEKAMDLLTNLMEWTLSQTGKIEFKPENIEIVDLVNETTCLYDAIAAQKSIAIKKMLPHNTSIFADKSLLSTVFRNLISNAIKFTNLNGEVIISAEKKQNEVIFSVTDTGIGIPKNDIAKLFQIDQSLSTVGTNDETGTGLGLILCKEFVEKHGGEIWVESEEGKGSRFYFTIPNK
ncbi:MAG: PAS domain-containing sensor histidine kinase [Bacteroidales bacterium]|nr:PAS domain-containing sensor histidine kinase [Bacteroidales bacterium]